MMNLKLKMNIFYKANSFLSKNTNRNNKLTTTNSKFFSTTLNNNNNNFTETESNEIISIKEKLIKLSLLNVEKHGWSEQSIKLAANELGYSNSLSALLPNGPIDLIYYSLDSWNNKLKNDLEEIKSNKKYKLSTEEKYIKAIKLRLSYEIPLINSWPQAMKLGMNPLNIKSTLDRLMIMTDEICSLEDDSSIIKRIFVLKIFLASELHMLMDRSYNYSNTWDFVNKAFTINFNIYNSINKFTMVNSALMTLIKYSLISFVPYDLSKVDEILKLQQEELEKKDEFVNNLHNKF